MSVFDRFEDSRKYHWLLPVHELGLFNCPTCNVWQCINGLDHRINSTMFSKLYYAVSNYFSELGYFLELHVKNMTPAKYSYILIGVFLFGWVLMKNQKK